MAGVAGVGASRPDLRLPGRAGAAEAAGGPAAKAARGISGSIRLRVFRPTGRVYAEILDPTTGEVVKTIPPLELLRISAKLRATVGLLLDREV